MYCDAHGIPNPKRKHSKQSWILTFIQTKAALYRLSSSRLNKSEHNSVSTLIETPVLSTHLLSFLPFRSFFQFLLYGETVKVTLQARGLERRQGAKTLFMRRQGAETPFVAVYFV